MAFEFVDAWTLTIKATRYELEESKLTSVDRGRVRTVVLEQGELSIQALYRIRSARQRLAIRLPEGVEFDSQPLKIDGQPVTPERGDAGTIYAPLVDQDPDSDFLLELRYTVEGRSVPIGPTGIPRRSCRAKSLSLCLHSRQASRDRRATGPGPTSSVVAVRYRYGLSPARPLTGN